MALTKVAGDILDPGIVVAGIVTATGFSGPFSGGTDGNFTGNVTVGGNLTVNGDYTTLNTTLREVELLRVDTNSSTTAGIITQRGSGDILNLFDTSTEVMTVVDGGKVGVGELAPRHHLTVKSGGANVAIAVSSTDAGSYIAYQDNTTGDTGTNSEVYAGALGGAFVVHTDAQSTPRLSIDNNGKVGIGITNPAEKLGVAGTIETSAGLKVAGHPVVGYASYKIGAGDYVTRLGSTGTSTLRSTQIYAGGNHQATFDGANNKVGLGVTNPDLRLHVNGTNAVPATSGSSPAGHLCLRNKAGNSSHGMFMGVSNAAPWGSWIQAQDANALGTEYPLAINPNGGNVGVGTDNPQRNVHIHQPTAANSYLHMTNSTTGATTTDGFSLYVATDGQTYYRARESTGTHVFYTGTTEKLRIDSDGAVNIGSNPAQATGTNTQNAILTIKGYPGGNESSAAILALIRGYNTTSATTDHTIGRIVFGDKQAGEYAFIEGEVEANGGSVGDTPGRLVFSTAPDGTSAPTEKLRIDASGHILPGAAGTQDLGSAAKEFRNLYLGDSGSVYFGEGQDVRAYYDATGSASFTIDSAAGYLYINSDALRLNSKTSGWSYLRGDKSDGVVKLYKSNSEELATSATGISVTGEVAASQDYPDQRPTLDFNFAAVKKLDNRIAYKRTGPASYIDEFGKVVLVGDNTPRFDHDPTTRECKGLLIEEGKTNINQCSALQYKMTGWSSTRHGYERYESETAPDGSTNAMLTYPNTGDNDVHYTYISSAGSSLTGQRTISAWFKNLGTTIYYPQLRTFGRGGGVAHATFVLTGDGTVSSAGSAKTGATITRYPNGWYRCTLSWNDSTGHYGGGWVIGNHTSNELPSYVADANKLKGFLMWGFQSEADHSVTSLIPTNGSTATRGLEYVSIEGDEHSDFWSTTEGTYLIDYEPLEPAVGDGVIIGSRRGSDGSGYPWPLYRYDTANTNIFKSYDLTTGIISISSAWADRRESWALGFNGTNGSIARNGSQLVTNNTSMKGLIDADELWLGSNGLGSNQYAMHVKRFMYYSKRISDAQLVTLTS